MNNDFAVNTNFQISQFNNTISDFNKAFDNSFKNSTQEISQNNEFEKIFNSIGQAPISGGISISSQNQDNISPVEQIAKSIGSGINKGLNDVNTIQKQAEQDFETFASGGDISVHDVMISAQKSNLSMQMAIQLRNRFLNMYNDFKNMGV